MEKQPYEILNFQDIEYSNAVLIEKPLDQVKQFSDDMNSVVIIREPFAYFDAMLTCYLNEKKSLLFTKEIIKKMEKYDGERFLTWLDSLSFIPFYNPQSYFLDLRKRIASVKKNLEYFDYVVPYESIEEFTTHLSSGLQIRPGKEKTMRFSLAQHKGHPLVEKFIGKDIVLYEQVQALWELQRSHGYLSLKVLKRPEETSVVSQRSISKRRIRGVVSHITSKTIVGWASVKGREKNVKVRVYRNGKYLGEAIANKMRPAIKESGKHPTGYCGFKMQFEKETFCEKDHIEVKVMPEEFVLPLGKPSQKFLKGTGSEGKPLHVRVDDTEHEK